MLYILEFFLNLLLNLKLITINSYIYNNKLLTKFNRELY